MSSAIDHEKREALAKAAGMDRVPLIKLDRLIKERKMCALENDAEMVDKINQMIKQLLGI